MKARQLGMLAVVAGVLGMTAWYAEYSRRPATAKEVGEGPLLPDFQKAMNKAKKVRVQGPEETYSVELIDGRWGLTDRGGYPVDFGELKQLLVNLSEADILEEKTSDPAKYSKLGVQDPGEGSDSTLLEVFGDSGTSLASLIIGTSRPGGPGAIDTTYVRRPGEAASWLVDGNLAPQALSSDLLDKQILELERDSIQGYRIVHPDGETLVAGKHTKDEANFVFDGLEEGEELQWAGIAGSLASTLNRLSFQDVQAAEGFEWPADPVKVEAWTWDGLRLDVEIAKQPEGEGKVFARLAAVRDGEGLAGLRPTPEAVVEEVPAGPELVDAENPEGTPAAPEAPEPYVQDVAAAAKQAEELSAAFEGWVFELAPFTYTALAKHRTDFIKPPPVEEQGPPTPGTEDEAGGTGLEGFDLSGALEELTGEVPPSIDDVLESIEEIIEPEVIEELVPEKPVGDGE